MAKGRKVVPLGGGGRVHNSPMQARMPQDPKAIEARAWSSVAAMENEADLLERAAKRLRERAAELHRAPDPKEE